MLRTATLAFLDELCRASHEAYPEGGTIWTYVEAANQAHSKFRDPRRKPAATSLHVEELARWLQSAQGDRSSTTARSVRQAEQLVGLLRDDLSSSEVLWSFEDNGSDMHAKIYLARESDNRYFALELWWSED